MQKRKQMLAPGEIIPLNFDFLFTSIFNNPDNMIIISDTGRGIPFGIKEDGTNVLVDIFSRPHTGGKFNDKVYNSVAGLNG